MYMNVINQWMEWGHLHLGFLHCDIAIRGLTDHPRGDPGEKPSMARHERRETVRQFILINKWNWDELATLC